MNKPQILANALGVAFATFALNSCGTNGAEYTPVNAPPGKGVVYIYRSPSMFAAAISATLTADGVPITKVKNGGYFPYVGPTGDTLFVAKTESSKRATVRVENGKSKYLKGEMIWGRTKGLLKLREVSPSVGQSEIADCKLLAPIPR